MYSSTLVLSAVVSTAIAQSTIYVTPIPSASATATSLVVSATGLSCPESNNTVYTVPSSGDQFIIECDVDHEAGDLEYVQVDSFEECIQSCDETDGCVDVSLSGVACYLKSSLGTSTTTYGIWSARLIETVTGGASAPQPTYSTATSVSCPDSNGTTFTTSTYSKYFIECGYEHAAGDMAMQYVDNLTECIELCDATEGCVDVSLSGSACYLKSSVGAITYDSDIQSARLVETGPMCPIPEGGNATYTTDDGLEFAIECDVDHPGGDENSVILDGDATSWFGQCIELCAQDSSCVDLSLSGAACYLKSDLNPSSSASGISGARLLSIRPSSTTNNSTSPSSTPTSTAHAISPVDVGVFQYLACYNDSVTHRVLTTGFLYGTTANPMTVEKCAEYCADYNYFGVEYGEECYCGTKPQGNTMEMPRACSMVCAGNGTEICGGDGAISLYGKGGSPAPNLISSSSAAASSLATTAPTTSSDSVSSSAMSSKITSATQSVSSTSLSPFVPSSAATSWVQTFHYHPLATAASTGAFPTSTGSANSTNGNSTSVMRRRGPRVGRPVRMNLNYEV